MAVLKITQNEAIKDSQMAPWHSCIGGDRTWMASSATKPAHDSLNNWEQLQVTTGFHPDDLTSLPFQGLKTDRPKYAPSMIPSAASRAKAGS